MQLPEVLDYLRRHHGIDARITPHGMTVVFDVGYVNRDMSLELDESEGDPRTHLTLKLARARPVEN